MPNSRGFALLEVLLAVVILSVGVIVVYQPLLASLSALNYADDRMEANYLISKELWELENKVYETGRFVERAQDETLLGKTRTYQYEMSSTSLSDDDKLFSINQRISWSSSGQKKTMTRDICLPTLQASSQ